MELDRTTPPREEAPTGPEKAALIVVYRHPTTCSSEGPQGLGVEAPEEIPVPLPWYDQALGWLGHWIVRTFARPPGDGTV